LRFKFERRRREKRKKKKISLRHNGAPEKVAKETKRKRIWGLVRKGKEEKLRN
jgi:hypothetical protein